MKSGEFNDHDSIDSSVAACAITAYSSSIATLPSIEGEGGGYPERVWRGERGNKVKCEGHKSILTLFYDTACEKSAKKRKVTNTALQDCDGGAWRGTPTFGEALIGVLRKDMQHSETNPVHQARAWLQTTNTQQVYAWCAEARPAACDSATIPRTKGCTLLGVWRAFHPPPSGLPTQNWMVKEVHAVCERRAGRG